jgi:transformation/transcription domain-associated protein
MCTWAINTLNDSSLTSAYSMLSLKKETRKRNLSFYIPVAIQLAPSLRLMHNDASNVIMSDIHDQFCDESGFSREETIIRVGDKVKALQREFRQVQGRQVRRSSVLHV